MKKLKQFKAVVFVAVLLAGTSLVGQTVRFRLPQVAGDPGTVANGDLWYNTSSNAVRARINGSTVSLGVGLTSPVGAADGGTGQTTPSADNVLVGDGSAWNKKALPSCSSGANDKLLYDSSTDTFSCGSDQAGSGGDVVLLQTQTASASSELALTSWYSSSYDEYEIKISALKPTADAELRAQFSTNAGSTWESSNYQLYYNYINLNGSPFSVNGTNSFCAFGSHESSSPSGFGATLNLHAPGSSSLKGFDFAATLLDSSGNYDYMPGGCVWTQTTAITGVKFYYNGTTIASGKVRIYGYKN